MTVSKIQKELKKIGLYLGRIDGINGNGTKDGIKKFQKANPPLTIDGIAGKKTLALLFPETLEAFGRLDKFPHQKDVPEYYGRKGKNQTRISLPYEMKIAWNVDNKIDQFYCHKKVAEPMQAIFEDALKQYGVEGIQTLGLDLFGGCLNVRKMRGGSRYSMHSWGIAVDLDPQRNKLRWNSKRAIFAKSEYEEFWDIVERHGAISLGRERDFDWMHFQFARL